MRCVFTSLHSEAEDGGHTHLGVILLLRSLLGTALSILDLLGDLLDEMLLLLALLVLQTKRLILNEGQYTLMKYSAYIQTPICCPVILSSVQWNLIKPCIYHGITSITLSFFFSTVFLLGSLFFTLGGMPSLSAPLPQYKKGESRHGFSNLPNQNSNISLENGSVDPNEHEPARFTFDIGVMQMEGEHEGDHSVFEITDFTTVTAWEV